MSVSCSEEEEEEEEDLFVFNDTIEGPRAPAVKLGCAMGRLVHIGLGS